MEELKFSTVLKEIPVKLAGKDNKEEQFYIRELNGDQRAEYNDSFDVKVEMKDGDPKIVAGEKFKVFSAKEFLSLCFYDKDDKLVEPSVIGKYPSSVLTKLHAKALELSGLDKKALEKAKNELLGNDSSGTESLLI